MKLTDAQIRGLEFIAKRDWPAGEPRLSWLHKSTWRKLEANGLAVLRLGSEEPRGFNATCIVDLTEAGRTFLSDLHAERTKPQ